MLSPPSSTSCSLYSDGWQTGFTGRAGASPTCYVTHQPASLASLFCQPCLHACLPGLLLEERRKKKELPGRHAALCRLFFSGCLSGWWMSVCTLTPSFWRPGTRSRTGHPSAIHHSCISCPQRDRQTDPGELLYSQPAPSLLLSMHSPLAD